MSVSKSKQHLLWYPGLEWLRAIFIVLVLMMHLGLLQIAHDSIDQKLFSEIFPFIHYVICCAAVPGFLIISCFLQEKKEPRDGRKEAEFFVGLGSLYVVWVGLWILVTKSTPEISFRGVIEFTLRGGGWAFYYFAVLIICHLLRMLTKRFSNSMLWCCLVISLIMVEGVFLFKTGPTMSWSEMTTYWWPICFIPTPWVGMLLARHEPWLRDKNRLYFIAGALTLLLVAAYVGERSLVSSYSITEVFEVLPEYLRVSPILAAGLMVLMSLTLLRVPLWVRWVSRNSLGIFCLHVFILGGIGKAVAIFLPDVLTGSIVTLMLTLLITSCASEVLRFALKRRVI